MISLSCDICVIGTLVSDKCMDLFSWTFVSIIDWFHVLFCVFMCFCDYIQQSFSTGVLRNLGVPWNLSPPPLASKVSTELN